MGDDTHREDRARPKAKAKTRAKSADIVRAKPSQFTPEESPSVPVPKRRALPPTFVQSLKEAEKQQSKCQCPMSLN